MQSYRRVTMKCLIKIGVVVLALIMGSYVYAERVMKSECVTKYNELKREKSDAHQNYIKSKRSLRTKLGKVESQSEVDAWEEQDWRITDDYNRKAEDMDQEMENVYDDPGCWERKE
jgi:hypothetical protein